MGTQQGRKWDLTDCGHLSSEGSSYDITSWPRGDHNNANDYSASGECTESPSTCVAEMLACAANEGEGTYSFYWYDPYGRNIFNYSTFAYEYACSWIGRFGETNGTLEIYKPGLYTCYIAIPGGNVTKYFNIYGQTSDVFLGFDGDDRGDGLSWAGMKQFWASAQSVLSSGNNLFVAEGDWSLETGFSFSKSMTINPVKKTWGGYLNISDSPNAYGNGSYTLFNVCNPIEMDGYINRWAFYCASTSSQTVKLKIYRGGNAGTVNKTTSTLIYTSDTHNESSTGWKTYVLSTPILVERGDILAIHSTDAYIGLKSVTSVSYGLASCCVVSGDSGDTIIGDFWYPSYDLMLRAWNSGTPFEIGLPRY